MRKLWTLNEIEQIAEVPLSKNDTFKKMWTLNEIKKIGGLDLEELDTSRRLWTKEELIYLLHDPYYIYALNIYKKSNLENIFAAAWKDMKEVDGAEIERTSTLSTQYGTLQYPNGENNGVIIPNSVTSIGDFAFYKWESNNHPLVIPDSVTSIDDYAFHSWTSNNQPLVIPDSVTSIGDFAFRYWKANNQPLVIPNSVTSIGQDAFRNWSLVPYIEMKSETPPTLVKSTAFANPIPPIYVPDVSVDDYKNATNWSALSSKIFSINDKP